MINYYQLITLITVCHLIFIQFEMLAFAVSVGLCFEFYERGDPGQVQALGELLCNSENLEAEIYNAQNFTVPQHRSKNNIIPTSKLIHCHYGILWRIWYGHNVEDWHLEFDEWFKKHTKP